MADFTNAPWSSPESDLNASDFCSVCLVDENSGSGPKVKDKCKLPIRSKPGAPINKNALQAVESVLAGGRGGVDVPNKQAIARKVASLMKQAGMKPGKSTMNMAMSGK